MEIIVLVLFVVIVGAIVIMFLKRNEQPDEKEKPVVVVDPTPEPEPEPKVGPEQKPDQVEEPVEEEKQPEETVEEPAEPKEPKPVGDPVIPGMMVDEILSHFSGLVTVEPGSKLYSWLVELNREAGSQYYQGYTHHGLPGLYKEECFPQIYNFYGEKGTEDAAYHTFLGWLFAMQLSELYPEKRTEILKIGYSVGGYGKDSDLYGYKFRTDPNIARLVASAVYSAMRGRFPEKIKEIRGKYCH